MGRITGSSSIETLVRVGIEKEHGLRYVALTYSTQTIFKPALTVQIPRWLCCTILLHALMMNWR